MLKSILDNDLYKFTMQQAVQKLYPRAQAGYTFTNRGKTPFPENFGKALRQQIEQMPLLKMTWPEKAFLKKHCKFLTPVYLDFLESFTFRPEEVEISQEGPMLHVEITGPWYRTILWEVPLMALISELYFDKTGLETKTRKQILETNQAKTAHLKKNLVPFADFGTRRRFSAEHHETVLRDILNVPGNTLTGTSNVYLAWKLDLPPIGTLAHEWFMFHAAITGYRTANPAGLDAWVNVYRGDLGIALADTYTTDRFLSGFDTFYAKLFDGVRQDSGNPFEFTDKMIQHYEALGIDPAGKTIVFSDGLNETAASDIREYCSGKIRSSFGIGTYLTNDVGPAPLNMVIKLSRCREDEYSPWKDTVKLSDDAGKHTGKPAAIADCLVQLGLAEPPSDND